MQMTSWGRLNTGDHTAIALDNIGSIAAKITGNGPGITYGMGRSYGDVCLNPGGVVWHTAGLDRFVSFNDKTGILRCEAGVTLREIQRLAIPRGWMLPVTPGTQWVTVGGAIANDVHGKNHHKAGSFGDHVEWMRLVRTDGQELICSAQMNKEWFAATVGGFGLTGVIAEVGLALKPARGPWLLTQTLPFTNLDEFFALSLLSGQEWDYTVAWIDCTDRDGERGLFMRGTPRTYQGADLPEPGRPKTVPFVPPVSLVNPLSLRAFNTLYFHLKRRQSRTALTHYEPFFYPLDSILEWNRIYGPKGFFQYQCVLPESVGKDAVREILRACAKTGEGSFLAVLKVFGKRAPVGLMSFPRPGVTLALDFPNRGERTQRLFERLDAVVREAKGRLYLAKDARMPADLFEAGYPNLSQFLQYRDPGISSSLSRRLIGS